jgi:hypothetical protein
MGRCLRTMGSWLLCFLAVTAEGQSAPADFRAVNRTLAAEPAGVLHLDAAPGDGTAWVTNKLFATGRISVEVRGANLAGRSFAGIAFHGVDDQTFEAVYLRPFNFNSPDPVRRAHSVQYVSMPAYPWQLLREKHPGKYEAALDVPVAADSWVRLTITVAANQVRVFIDDSAVPVLSIESLNSIATGGVGLWVGNASEGRFRNLVFER